MTITYLKSLCFGFYNRYNKYEPTYVYGSREVYRRVVHTKYVHAKFYLLYYLLYLLLL